MTNLIAIAALTLNLTNFVFQVEPATNTSDYYTDWGTNKDITATALFTAFLGPCVRLSWSRPAQPVVIQASTNLSSWQDIRVVFRGAQAPTNWLVVPTAQAMFYRLRSAP